MRGAELDTLVALVEQGPLWDGDLPSKTGRDCLRAALRLLGDAQEIAK